MKKLASMMMLLMVAAIPLSAAADEVTTNYGEYYKKIVQSIPPQPENKNSQVYKPANGNQYTLKYNIDDLESAPWVNGGKRKLN